MKNILILFLGICTASTAFAAGPAGGGGFMGAAALSAGIGESKDASGSIPKTDLAYAEATLQLGYRIGFVAPLAQLGLRHIGQTTDADKVNGNNVGGTGYTAGAGLEFNFAPVRLVAVMNMAGKFDMDKESSGGSKVSYDKVSGLHALLGYNWKPSWEFFVSTSLLKYKQKTAGSTKTDLKDNPLSQTLYGFGISYLF